MSHVSIPDLLELATQKLQSGNLPEAEALCGEILRHDPDHVLALQGMGLVCHWTGRNGKALLLLKRRVTLQPTVADFHNTLGTICLDLQREEEAVMACGEAVRLRPDYPEGHCNAGIALERLGRFEEAEAANRKAIGLRPGYAAATVSLAGALRGQGKLDEAIALLEGWMAVEPSAQTCGRLAAVLSEAGRLDDSIARHRQAVEMDPTDSSLHSNLLYTLHYHPDLGPEQLLAEHLVWAERHAEPLYATIKPHDIDRTPGRRLRIGFVSGDFRQHSVATFLEPLIVNHDPGRVEVFCYSDVSRPDAVTRRFQVAADTWRIIVGLNDEQAAELIRQDRLDILVDPGGHMGPNRPLLFARKPAPVQMAYPGYPGTTGMKTMDYFVTDALHDPPGESEGHYVETLLRLSPTFRCYRPPDLSPEPNSLPALTNGFMTFGSIGRMEKITPAVMKVWAEILSIVPDSRLLVLTGGGNDVLADRQFRPHFVRHGLAGERVRFIGRKSPVDYFRFFHRIDIVLDTFPYNGCTTTCDALWMGVPVVTLAGNRHAARCGAGMLAQIGRCDLVAHDAEGYLRVACDLISDVAELSRERASAREKMQVSALFDQTRFAVEWSDTCRAIPAQYVQLS